MGSTDREIEERERVLRNWFTRGASGPRVLVDGLDIGWGGVQRWATSRMPDLAAGHHLDLACGYATFLAQLGWRFPEARLVGLNIDFEGVHALARPLLGQAGVKAELVQADARYLPFTDGVFDSVSCFMGLQDIEIAFGEEGMREAVRQSVRVVRDAGTLCYLDEYRYDLYESLLSPLGVRIRDRAERELDIRWDRATAEFAISLYSRGWLEQRRLGDPGSGEAAVARYTEGLKAEVESQLRSRGYFVPHGPGRMVVCEKVGGGLRSCPQAP